MCAARRSTGPLTTSATWAFPSPSTNPAKTGARTVARSIAPTPATSTPPSTRAALGRPPAVSRPTSSTSYSQSITRLVDDGEAWVLDGERGDEVSGAAVRALDPAWRQSDSGASVLVFESGKEWDAGTDTTLSPLRFVALDAGVFCHPRESWEDGKFSAAYRLAREEYSAPLPRWEPAHDGERDHTAQPSQAGRPRRHAAVQRRQRRRSR